MNVKSKALRVIGTIFAVLFSIALVVTVIASAFLSFATNLTKPETISTIIREVNVVEKVLGSDDMQQVLQQQGINTEIVNEFVDSPFFHDTIEVYTNEVIDSIQGKASDIVLSEDVIKQIAGEHMDSLVALVEPHLPEDVQVTTQQIETKVNDLVEEYAPTIVENLPSGEEIRELLVQSEVRQPVELLVSDTVPVVMYGVIGGLAVLVFVCLLHRFRGLLCLGIDALVAALLLLAPYLLIRDGSLISSFITDAADVIAPLIMLLSERLLTYLIVLSAVGVVFIAGFITYRVLMKKKAAVAQAIEPQPLPAQEI